MTNTLVKFKGDLQETMVVPDTEHLSPNKSKQELQIVRVLPSTEKTPPEANPWVMIVRFISKLRRVK